MDTEMTIIEINGVKMEVDLRQAKIVHQNLRVGSKVKLLVKSDYGDPGVYPGVIIGFDAFPSHPTIQVCYLKSSYSSTGLEFAAINAKSGAKFELIPSVDDELPIDRGNVMETFEREITKHRRDIEDIEAKRDFFARSFGAYFKDLNATTVEA